MDCGALLLIPVNPVDSCFSWRLGVLAANFRFGFPLCSLCPLWLSFDTYCGTAIPFFTAGRAEIASYQRFTAGKSPSSTLCHSWRATQG